MKEKVKHSVEFLKFEAPVQESANRLDSRYRFGSHQLSEGEINYGAPAKTEENRAEKRALRDSESVNG